jgi:hypothetical protein
MANIVKNNPTARPIPLTSQVADIEFTEDICRCFGMDRKKCASCEHYEYCKDKLKQDIKQL